MDELEQAQLRIKELEGELALVRKASAQETKDLTTRLKQLEQSWTEEQQRSLRAEALSELRNPDYKLISPEQFWKLFGADAVKRASDGSLFVEDQGMSRNIRDWVLRLSLEPENAHHFQQESSIVDRVKSAFNPQNNPWKRETWNLTEQGRVFQRDPSLAERLRREAGR